MARQTFNITFNCREQKKDRNGEAPIEMTVIINGERSMIRLQRKAKPQEFKKQMKNGGEIFDYCLLARKKVDTLALEMMRNDIPLTTAMLKDFFKRGGVAKEYTLKDLFEEYFSFLSKRTITADTFNRYTKAKELFLLSNNLNESLPAKTVGYSHMLAFQNYLYSRIQVSTACNYLQKIKTIFKYAFETGKIPSNPGYLLKIDKGEKDTVQYLTQEELKSIRNHTFGKRLQEIADVFVFSCYTGLAFADVAELEPKDFIQSKGFIYVSKPRKKTGVRFFAILFEDAREIAEKYDFRLPVKSNQKTNAYLKEIADICGIDKPLHFHMARHTAACYLLNHRPALPNETIMKICGWSNEKQLRHYARLFGETILTDVVNAGFTKPVSRESLIIPDEDLRDIQKFLGI